MTITEPNQPELAKGVPTITLAGKAWPIPIFSFRQNKIAIPIIIRLGKGDALTELTEQTMHDLGTLVYTALTRAHPTLTRAEFEDLPIGTADLIASINVIAEQTGALTRGEVPESTTTAASSTVTQ